MAHKKNDPQFVEDAENPAEEDTKQARRQEAETRQAEAQEASDNTPRSADGTPITDFEQAQAARFEPLNTAPEGEVPVEALADADTGAIDESALGPLGSATQTGGTSYYAATDIKPAYATPYYPPTDYAHAVINSTDLTNNPEFGAVYGLVAGDPFPPENFFEDQIETDGRANDSGWTYLDLKNLEVKDYERRLHAPLFGINAAFRAATTGKLPYPTNPQTGGGASGAVQSPETPS
jgi:hypothetical protein